MIINYILFKKKLVLNFGFKPVLMQTIANLFRIREPNFNLYEKAFAGKSGLEIGGPSAIFSRKSTLPIYALLNRLDNCQFASKIITSLITQCNK